MSDQLADQEAVEQEAREVEAERRARRVLLAPEWREFDEHWPEHLIGRDLVREDVRKSAVVNAVARLRDAFLSPGGQFGRLPDLWRVRKDPESPGGRHDTAIRSEMTELYAAWLGEIGRWIKNPATPLSAGPDQFRRLILDASHAVAAALPEMVRTEQFPFQRHTRPPTSVARAMGTVIGDTVIDSLRNLDSVEKWWVEFGNQSSHDPLDPRDDDQGRRQVDSHWLDSSATDRPTEEAALGPVPEAGFLLDHHPYLQRWATLPEWADRRDSMEAIAEDHSRHAEVSVTPAQMFAKILRVTIAHDLDDLRPGLDDPWSRRWLEEYLPQVIGVRPFHAGWGLNELVTLATAVITLDRAPEEDDWPDIVQMLPGERTVNATKKRWYELLIQRPGVALLVPWEKWPRWIGLLAAVLPRGLQELEASRPEEGRQVRAAIERLGDSERAATALLSRYGASRPISYRDIADALSEDAPSGDWPSRDGFAIDESAAAHCIETLCAIPWTGPRGYKKLGDLLERLREDR